VRGAGDPPQPTLAHALTLPPEHAATGRTAQNGDHRSCQVKDGWSQYVGDRPVVIARNLEEARSQLLQTLNVAEQEPVLLPANATHPLVASVKQSGAKPGFGELDQDLKLCSNRHFRIAWVQPPLGLPTQSYVPAEITVLDHGDSVPLAFSASSGTSFTADVEIFGLHLSPDLQMAGALLVFNNEALYARMQRASTEVEPVVYRRAAQQLERLRNIVPRQQSALEIVRAGLQSAAGLPLLPLSAGAALAHGVAVRIPAEGSPSTFWAYARGENTPIQWLPELRPVHYAAGPAHTRTAANLERWFFVPVLPTADAEANRQTLLGIVKTAEYLGLRWRTEPACAAQYAALLDAMYGLNHDAYRPAFSIDAKLPAEVILNPADVLGPACSI
jgi:hypothetical protein